MMCQVSYLTMIEARGVHIIRINKLEDISMKKALTAAFVIIFTLLFTYTCFLGDAATTWSYEMTQMTYFDLDCCPTAYRDELPRFYTDTGLCYEACDVPEGITRDMLTKGLSPRKYNEIVTTEDGMEYHLYRDPLQTGEKYALIVPADGTLYIPLTTIDRPLGYYAKEVPKA